MSGHGFTMSILKDSNFFHHYYFHTIGNDSLNLAAIVDSVMTCRDYLFKDTFKFWGQGSLFISPFPTI